jgi:hypothetical protein
MYPDSLHVDDVVLFVSPGDVEDAAYYAGEDAAAAAGAAAAAAALQDGSSSRLQWLGQAAVSRPCSMQDAQLLIPFSLHLAYSIPYVLLGACSAMMNHRCCAGCCIK